METDIARNRRDALLTRSDLTEPVERLIAQAAGDDHHRAPQLAHAFAREITDQRTRTTLGGGAKHQRVDIAVAHQHPGHGFRRIALSSEERRGGPEWGSE